MVVHIKGIFEAEKIESAQHIISLVDPGKDLSKLPPAEHHLKIYLKDNLSDPKKEHIDQLFSFFEDTYIEESEEILIHCHMGISRSTAAALGFFCWMGDSPIRALEKVLSLRIWAQPNERLCELISKKMNNQLDLIIWDYNTSTTGVFIADTDEFFESFKQKYL